MSFSPSEVDFLRRLLASRPEFRRNDGVANRVSEGHGIGEPSGSRILYGPSDFERARNSLSSRNIDLTAPEPGYSRSEAGPGLSEKVGARPVSDGLMATVPLNMDVTVPSGAAFVAVHWEAALKWRFEAVLECENFEPLLRLEDYSWLKEFVRGRPLLAVYRGGPQMFRAAAPAAFLRAAGKPVLGFYDFDPAGLSMAAGEPNLEALCLPPWERILSRAQEMRRPDLYYPQLKACQGTLESLPEGPVREAWLHLKRVQWGLDQESFPR